VWLWLVEGAGANPRRLVSGGFPSWKADSRGIYFSTRPDGDVYSVDLEPGARPRRIYEGHRVSYPALSPDGTRLAYLQGSYLNVVDTRTGVTLTRVPTAVGDTFFAAFSPDGRNVAYGGMSPSSSGLWLLRLDPTEIRFLLRGPFTMPAWSPDGRMLAFDMRMDGETDVWVESTEGYYKPYQSPGPAPVGADGKWHDRATVLPELGRADLSGRVWHLEDIQGRLIFIAVWSTTCAPAREQLPLVQGLYEQSRNRSDLLVLTLNTDSDRERARRFASAMNLTVPVIPAVGYTDPIPGNLLPQNWIVGPGHRLLSERIGYYKSEHENWLENALAELARVRSLPASGVPATPPGKPR
jgi:hypothetical protein